MCFKIDWASLKVGSKFFWRGDLTEAFRVTSLGGLHLEGLIHGGAYFRNFTVFMSGLISEQKQRFETS